jgi:REP element-mobilizing transposase RayT
LDFTKTIKVHLVEAHCLVSVKVKDLSQAKKFNIQIYEFALNWSHIHLVIRLKDQNDYQKFIRSMTSIIAQKIKMKYCASGRHYEKTFELRPFTRILNWGKDFKNALCYQVLNQLEARGLVVRKKKRQTKPGSHFAITSIVLTNNITSSKDHEL